MTAREYYTAHPDEGGFSCVNWRVESDSVGRVDIVCSDDCLAGYYLIFVDGKEIDIWDEEQIESIARAIAGKEYKTMLMECERNEDVILEFAHMTGCYDCPNFKDCGLMDDEW